MAVTYNFAEARNINASSVNLFTVTTGAKAVITAVVVDNNDVGAQSIDSIDFSGSIYVRNKSIPVGGSVLTDIEGQILDSGDTLNISATGSFLSIRVSYKELS